MDITRVQSFVDEQWERTIVPELIEYIRIPNKSVAFDAEWAAHGHMDKVVARFEAWAQRQPIKGMTVAVVRLANRTPVIFIDIPGASNDCILLYGHMDKQPEMAGWRDGLSPWTPVREGDRLYGRGSADDGYAIFACLTSIAALQAASIPHARCVVLIEACEESGSFDLPAYIDHLAPRIGSPSLVIALDSGCGNYEQLWCTTSLRGLVGGTLKIHVLSEGTHSGDAGGVVADSFRILRQLLSRVEDESTGAVKPKEFHAEIPEGRRAQAIETANVLGEDIYRKFPFVSRMRPMSDDLTELVLNRTWRPALAVIGADGLPPAENAGNVLRPSTTVKLSVRLPPTCDPKPALQKLKTILERDPPHGAQVSFEPNWGAQGWDAPPLALWLERSLDSASREFFGKPPAYMGEGGTIPFMSMLGERFPAAQFLITGVLGPHANAHGPNEFLHIPTGRRVTGCVSRVIADHFRRTK
jgi:acetylornithine deacetylase/succinyl-diaminopimelate desuccinylase-like protein